MRVEHTRLELLDGKLATLAMTAHGFVYAAISARTDEADDLVSIDYSDFALVSHTRAGASIRRV
jgi:hypothetical protein